MVVKRGREPRICENCGSLFTPKLSSTRPWKARFCSRGCAGEHRHKRYKLVPCKLCGKPFEQKPHHGHLPEFCSHVCYTIWEQQHCLRTRTCPTCGTEFIISGWGNTMRRQTFCSQECYYQNVEAQQRRLSYMQPNKVEKKLDDILQRYFPETFIYSGDLSVGVMIGKLIPDFVNVNGRKQIIELFGDYWHNKDKRKDIRYYHTPKGRKEIYARFGFTCLIIWESELEDRNREPLIAKIDDYINGKTISSMTR